MKTARPIINVLTIALLVFTLPLFAGSAEVETPGQRDARMAWWREARFGMFVHWGVYAVPAGEWNGDPVKGISEWIQSKGEIPVADYEPLKNVFNPVKYDADAWVRLAKDAGMKYIVITSKHHDGFCLWDSAQTDWDIASTPYKKDLLKPLAEACRKHGIKLCFYHSIMDWHHPDYDVKKPWRGNADNPAPDMDAYTAYMKAQLKELLSQYGDIGVLWFDGEWESAWTHERGVDLDNYLRAIQPSIIINNRIDKGRKGMQGMSKDLTFRGDFGTPEQEIPHEGLPGVDWESCMTMNTSWGYKASDQNWKSTEHLIRNLVDIASKGGNYLLNVGPTAEGLIPAPSVERLREMGKWMQVNGESIHGTSASPLPEISWGRCTMKTDATGTTFYLHVFQWPEDGRLVVPGLNLKKAQVKTILLADGKPLTGEASEDRYVVEVGAKAPDPIDSVIVLKVDGAYEVLEYLPHANGQGILTLTPEMAAIHNPEGAAAHIEYKGGKSNIGFWINEGSRTKWVFQIEKAGRYKIEAEVALNSLKSQLNINCGSQNVVANLAGTGGYDSFQRVVLGELDLPSGKCSLTLSPIAGKWNPVNMRSLVLGPVE